MSGSVSPAYPARRAGISLYEVSIPAIEHGLATLGELIDRGSAHLEHVGRVSDELMSRRLTPDMLTFAGQVQRATDTAKFVVQRLTGRAAPRFADDEETLDQLRERIAATRAFVAETRAEDFDRAPAAVEFGFGPQALKLSPSDYILRFAFPNFYFHVATAHDILRTLGVPVGKRDYLGLDRLAAIVEPA